MKSNKGYVYFDESRDCWYARVTFTDANGKRKDIKKKVENKRDGKRLLIDIVNSNSNSRQANGRIREDSLTLTALTHYYERIYCTPPQYVNGRKVAGLRSYKSVIGYMKVFRDHFGKRKLHAIKYEDLYQYRLQRLLTSTHQSKKIAIATVNRELAYLRRILNIAERNDWIIKNPFKRGDSLIHQCDEVRRDRVLTPEECQRLIDACTERRAHLKPIVIAALDTGCRLGELLKLRWDDVDLKKGIIIIRAFNTKTMRERKVAITQRLKSELQDLSSSFPHLNQNLVFGVSEVRGSFKSACKVAGLSDLRFHDLRHVHATNLDSLGFSIAAIGKQLGHTSDSKVTLRYINRTDESIREVAKALDEFQTPTRRPREEKDDYVFDYP